MAPVGEGLLSVEEGFRRVRLFSSGHWMTSRLEHVTQSNLLWNFFFT